MMQKGQILIWVIVGILVVAVTSGGFLLYTNYSNNRYKINSQNPVVTSQTPQPTPDASPAPTGAGETANWKTYTNNTYGFSIKYPDKLTYRITEKTDYDGKPFLEIWFENQSGNSESSNAVIIRVVNINDIPIAVWKERSKDIFYVKEDDNQWKDISIGDFQGMYVESTGGYASGFTAILEANGKNYNFHLVQRDNPYITNDEFKQILSAFELLK